MKKIALALVLTIICLAIGFAALSEEADYSSYSVEDLMEMRNSIDQEIYKRYDSIKDVFVQGMYKCPSDLEPGRYTIVCTNPYDSKTASVSYYAAKTDEEGNRYFYMNDFWDLHIGEKASITLSEEDRVEIRYGEVIFIKN